MRTSYREFTLAKAKQLAEAADVKILQLRALTNSVLATGFVKLLEPVNGIIVSVGSVKGQREYSADVVAETGLIVELRTHGSSYSEELEAPYRTTHVTPGDTLVSGKSASSKWKVDAEAQGQFETVSVRFKLEYLAAMREHSPEIVEWALALVKSDFHDVVEQDIDLAITAQKLIHCARNYGPNSNLLLQSLSLQLLADIWSRQARCAEQKPQDQIEHDIIAFAISEVENNPSTSVTIQDIARLCRMSESAMKARFKQATGRPLGRFILETRMQKASEMLNQGVPAKAAARTLGYASSEAFSRAVKSYFGRSPRKF